MATPETGQSFLHYRVLKKLGEGGMGAVYLAEDTKLNRRVALKFLPAEMANDQERLKRFEREAKTVAALNHPNIVTIFSVEEVNGIPFIAMELVEGKSLSDAVPGDGLSLDQFFEVAIPIADAVSAAHDRGITHRDIKPANIMVTNQGRVKVLDFGLAKLMPGADEAADGTTLSTQTLTQDGKTLGTITYMAPEQLKGKTPDQRADIFSLGIVFYQLASGRRPFEGETSAEVISSILRDSPPPVTDVKIELPSHLGRIVKRCLEKNPNRRYQSAGELRNELEELKEEIDSGQVFESEAKTKVLTVRRDPRHDRWKILSAAAAGLLLVALLVFLATRGDDDALPADPLVADEVQVIAVLPFTSRGAPAESFFSDGLSEEVASRLTDLEGLQVVSSATTARQATEQKSTREIGESLSADYVLTGSVRWVGTDEDDHAIRTLMQVVRVEDDIQVWSESFDRVLTDELALQTELAQWATRGIGRAVLEIAEYKLPPEPVLEAETEKEPELQPVQAVTPRQQRQAPSPVQQPEPEEAPTKKDVKILDSPAEPSTAAAPKLATIDIEFVSHLPEGILTIYADDEQILSEEFKFTKKKGLLARRKAAGEINAQRAVPVSTQNLRIYVLIENETQLTTLATELTPSASYRLAIELTRKGTIEASVE